MDLPDLFDPNMDQAGIAEAVTARASCAGHLERALAASGFSPDEQARATARLAHMLAADTRPRVWLTVAGQLAAATLLTTPHIVRKWAGRVAPRKAPAQGVQRIPYAKNGRIVVDHDRTAFLRAIALYRFDTLPRLVYADWLDETGCPDDATWAERIRAAADSGPRDGGVRPFSPTDKRCGGLGYVASDWFARSVVLHVKKRGWMEPLLRSVYAAAYETPTTSVGVAWEADLRARRTRPAGLGYPVWFDVEPAGPGLCTVRLRAESRFNMHWARGYAYKNVPLAQVPRRLRGLVKRFVCSGGSYITEDPDTLEYE